MAGRQRCLVVVVGVLAGVLGLAPVARSADVPPPGEGAVLAYGDAAPLPTPAPEDAVGIASTPLGLGWWATSADGHVAAAGDAVHRGDVGGRPLNQPVVGMARTPSGGGYWLVASDGGIFSFGDARFSGSTGAMRLNQPVVGMAPSPSGGGYWLAAADGGVFTFGDAVFRGAGRGPVTGIAATPTGGGYWLAGGDGHVDALGDAVAAGEPGTVSGAVTGIAATPSGRGYWVVVGRVHDVVAIAEPGGLHGPAQQWALDAAARAGARAAVHDSGNVDLLAVRRGAATVQAAPGGWRIPMSATAVDPAASAQLIGATAAAALVRGDVVLGTASARYRGAQVGDVVDVLGWDGRIHTFLVGALVPDARAGATELLFSKAAAASIGFRYPISVKLWGAPRGRIEEALAARPSPVRVSVSRTWEYDPDDVAPLIRLKQALGEPVYRPGRGDSVTLHPSFTRGITTGRVPLLGNVTCHAAIFPALRGALADVANAGLGGGLGRYGGCYNARLIRGGDSAGRLSRHSFGIALDVNVTHNSYGGRVSMDPRIVDIFRRWGFAWGGTWARADGMHFEWAPR